MEWRCGYYEGFDSGDVTAQLDINKILVTNTNMTNRSYRLSGATSMILVDAMFRTLMMEKTINI